MPTIYVINLLTTWRHFILQILLHHDNSVGMMQETGIAISPGLYSLLAVEKTEVYMYMSILWEFDEKTWIAQTKYFSRDANWKAS